MQRLLFSISAAAFSVCFNAVAAPYSEAPFQQPVFDQARMLVESVGVNNWLNANYPTLTPKQTTGVREHIHALIDSRMKEQYATSHSLVPKPDPVLAILFSWAARLGVYGADDIFRVVRGGSPLQTSNGPVPPSGISVALNGDVLDLASPGKWSVSVPTTFFVFDLRIAAESEDQTTQAAVIATGTAPDAAPPGYSQATIAIIYTEGSRPSTSSATWSERLGVPQSAPSEPIEGSTYKSRRAYDSSTRLHKEVVFIESSRASMAVLYSGLDGTYQWNRPHFVDFLKDLKVQP